MARKPYEIEEAVKIASGSKSSDPAPSETAENIQEKIRRKANQRLMSLDALRGLNMLCIIGLAGLIAAICNLDVEDFRVFGNGAVKAAAAFRQAWPGPSPESIAKHMDHVSWSGVRHHDTIFPLFLFLAGVSFPFSFAKQRANGRPMRRVWVKAFSRGILLFIAGYVYSNAVRFNFGEMRVMGVLQHIGLAWMFAAFIYLIFAKRIKTQVGICAGILVVYWLFITLVPSHDVCGDEAFTGAAFKERAAQLFTIRAPEKIFEETVAEQAPAENAAAEQAPAESVAAEQAPAEENGAETAVAEEPKKRHSLKGIVAAMFDENPCPTPDDPNYPALGSIDHNLLPEGCVANYIDRQFVPGKLYHDHDNFRRQIRAGELPKEYDWKYWHVMWDPEGLASTFPAIVTALLGMLFGGVLRREDALCPKMKKVGLLVGWGVVLLIVGFLWHLIFPINKALWNSTFVCFVGGYSAIALAIAYLLVDVWRMRWLGFPFAVVGMNSIGIYMIRRIVDFTNTRDFFFKDAIARFIPNQYVDPNTPAETLAAAASDPNVTLPMIDVNNFQSIGTSIAGLIVSWLFLFWLYKKKIFFKI